MDAAVDDVLGTLLVSVAAVRTCLRLMPSSCATTCATLVLEPLAHLGAAMADQHRAVGVDIHQRTSLVELHDVKGDANLTGVRAMPSSAPGSWR